MEDQQIIDLYWQRNTQAIDVTEEKYGGQLQQMAENLLEVHEDAEECVNDTYLAAWNSMPEQRPQVLCAFLCRITRNLALKKHAYNQAQKRNTAKTIPLDELYETVGKDVIQESWDAMHLAETISAMLRMQSDEARNIFLRRYWFCDSVKDIAKRFGVSESKVKSSLMRTRNRLKEQINKQGDVQ